MAPSALADNALTQVTRALLTQRSLLQKATSHSKATTLPAARLVDDMLPLSFQVRVSTGTALKMVYRLTGQEQVDSWSDEKDGVSLESLVARIDDTIKLVKGLDAAAVNGLEDKEVELQVAGAKETLTVQGYVFGYTLPNVYFHTDMTYAILRKEGVEVGKMDYLKEFLAPWVREGAWGF